MPISLLALVLGMLVIANRVLYAFFSILSENMKRIEANCFKNVLNSVYFKNTSWNS